MMEIKVDTGATCGRSHMRCSPNISARTNLYSLCGFPQRAQRQGHKGLLRGLKSAGTRRRQSSLYPPVLSPHRIKHLEPFSVSSDLLWTQVEVDQDERVTQLRSKLVSVQLDYKEDGENMMCSYFTGNKALIMLLL